MTKHKIIAFLPAFYTRRTNKKQLKKLRSWSSNWCRFARLNVPTGPQASLLALSALARTSPSPLLGRRRGPALAGGWFASSEPGTVVTGFHPQIENRESKIDNFFYLIKSPPNHKNHPSILLALGNIFIIAGNYTRP
jgi:hypothetical protein